MKTVWEQIPMFVKVTTGITAAVAAAIMWMLSTFETTSASDQKWQYHNQAIQCQTVYNLKAKIQQYMERLRFDRNLTAADREWIRQQIELIENEVRRIDPEGRC
jgi:N-glycosylase/DNA lyase